MSKNHSGRPLNVNHHSRNKMQPQRVASRMEGGFRGEHKKPGRGN